MMIYYFGKVFKYCQLLKTLITDFIPTIYYYVIRRYFITAIKILIILTIENITSMK